MVKMSVTNLYLADIFTIIASIPTLVVLKNITSGVYRLYPFIWAAAEILNIKEKQKLCKVYNFGFLFLSQVSVHKLTKEVNSFWIHFKLCRVFIPKASKLWNELPAGVFAPKPSLWTLTNKYISLFMDPLRSFNF